MKKVKLFTTLLITLALCCLGAVPTLAESSPQNKTKVLIGNQPAAFEVPPHITKDTLLVPANSLGEILNLKVTWTHPGDNFQFTITKNGLIIEMEVGSSKALVNGKSIDLKAAPDLTNGKLFVPLRTVAEAANLVVKWDNSIQAAIVEPANKVVAYYIEWGIYGRNFQVADIDASKVTHINYAFANIKDGEIALGDPWADIDKPFPGDCETAGCLKGNFNQLLKLKKEHPLLQTLISVGGWTWSGQFSDIAMTDASRNKFADSVVKFIRAYGFDGVDLDWEYPVAGGLDDNKRSPKDKQNYTLLLKTIRDKFDIAGKQDGKHYSITIAAGASPSYIQNTEPAKIANILDWINVMTYDFHGTWEAKSGQNAPLYYDPKDPDSSSNVFYADAAINGFLNAGVPAKQLVLGLPFYGHGWKQCAPDNGGQYQICNGAAPGTWESGSVDFYDLETNYINKNGYVRYWNDSTKTPYLYNAQNGTYISYDDAESFGYKVEYIQSKGLGGAMFWEITSDKNKTLLNKLSGSLIK